MDRETGAKVEGGVDITSLKDQTPHTGKVEDAKTGGASAQAMKPLFSLSVQWHYLQNEQKVFIPIDQLQFCPNPFVFFQKGVDSLGNFTVEGKPQANGSVRIDLNHSNKQQSKVFNGKFEDNILAGTWEDASHGKGAFTIEMVASVWKTEGTSISLKSATELVGIGLCSYGWAMITGKETTKPKSLLSFFFADGKTGSFDCDLSEDVMSGVLRHPTGDAEISLSNKNEFA
jgi:hypothetical protein